MREVCIWKVCIDENGYFCLKRGVPEPSLRVPFGGNGGITMSILILISCLFQLKGNRSVSKMHFNVITRVTHYANFHLFQET